MCVVDLTVKLCFTEVNVARGELKVEMEEMLANPVRNSDITLSSSNSKQYLYC